MPKSMQLNTKSVPSQQDLSDMDPLYLAFPKKNNTTLTEDEALEAYSAFFSTHTLNDYKLFNRQEREAAPAPAPAPESKKESESAAEPEPEKTKSSICTIS
jgi:hypothetical protein